MKFSEIAKKFTRKAHLVAAVLVGVTGLGVGIAAAEYYPARQAYDYNKPCNANDADKYDRCGSLEGPVFNSFVNTPSYGDERAFVDAARTDQTAAGSYKNVLPDVTQGSKEVVIRMYVHNNANQSTNASGQGVAKNTTVRFNLPEAEGSSLRARGYISADNATPKIVEDTVDLTSGEAFTVSYIPGSARFVNNQGFKAGVALPDSIVTTGARIGDDALDGNLPGCFEYEGVVHIRVKVTPKQQTKIDFSKQVNKADASGWTKNVTSKPGEKLKWLISFKNSGAANLTNVKISDKLPPHVKLVPGTVRYIDANNDTVQGDAPLFGTGGINFNTWAPNGGFYVRFETTVLDDFQGCEANIRNIAYHMTDQTPKGEDYSDVKIVKENCNPTTPSYVCTLLTLTPKGDRRYEFKTAYTAAGGATFKQVTYTITVDGKSSEPFVTTNATNADTQLPVGSKYTVRATPQFTVNGQTVSAAENANCAVSFDTTTQTPITPVKASVLPATGAAGIISLFGISTLAGALAYRWRLSRQ